MNSFGNASKDAYTETKAESERGENVGEKRKARGSREEDDEKVLWGTEEEKPDELEMESKWREKQQM